MDRHTASLAPCQALARTLGWITSVATMVVLGFIANRWPGRFGSIAGGMVGVRFSFSTLFLLLHSSRLAVSGCVTAVGVHHC